LLSICQSSPYDAPPMTPLRPVPVRWYEPSVFSVMLLMTGWPADMGAPIGA